MIRKIIENKEKIVKILQNKKLIFTIVIVVAVIASAQKYFQQHGTPGVYLIYKHAFYNLINLKDLYSLDPNLHLDYFLYPPPFLFLMIPCVFLPDLIGCIVWNLIGLFLMLWAVNLLPIKSSRKTLFVGILFFDLLSSMQNFQANVLVTSLILLTFIAFEKNKNLYAALCCAVGFFTKIFGVGFAVFFLFHKKKFKFILILAIILTVLFFLPLILTGFDTHYFVYVYKRWIWSLSLNTTSNINFPGVLNAWFGINLLDSSMPVFTPIQIFALLFAAIPLIRIRQYQNLEFRLIYLASLLIWVVIFNPKAESPTYIIAMTGVAVWFASQEIKPWKIAVLAFAILFTSMSSTDLFPKPVRQNFCTPYGIKAVPCILIWFISFIQLCFNKFRTDK